MARESSALTRTRCVNCGFETEPNSGKWGTADHPTLGTLTKCPECGSTNTTSL
jgi:DNA-directed RNA polymerase subunit RPC12/RpoP